MIFGGAKCVIKAVLYHMWYVPQSAIREFAVITGSKQLAQSVFYDKPGGSSRFCRKIQQKRHFGRSNTPLWSASGPTLVDQKPHFGRDKNGGVFRRHILSQQDHFLRSLSGPSRSLGSSLCDLCIKRSSDRKVRKADRGKSRMEKKGPPEPVLRRP